MTKRNYGIDLLRCISMLMVVTLHIMGHGGVLKSAPSGSNTYKVAWLIEIVCYGAVNCYALISGYVGVNSNHKLRNIVPLWLQVLFYSVVITLLFYLFSPELVTGKTIVSSFFPTIHKFYWYFTAYFALFFLMPFINKGICALNKKEAARLCLALFVIFPIFRTMLCFNVGDTFSSNDIFNTNGGYSVIWLLILYVMGGCISKFHLLQKIRTPFLLLAFVGSVAISLGFKLFMESGFAPESLKKIATAGTFISYVSPTVVVMSISLLLLFSRLSDMPAIPKAITVFLAPVSFSVYLIQEHPLVRAHFVTGKYTAFAADGVLKLVLYTFLAVIIFYLGCCLIDHIRLQIFKLLRIKPLLNRICDGRNK